jgi:hypothetical protein
MHSLLLNRNFHLFLENIKYRFIVGYSASAAILLINRFNGLTAKDVFAGAYQIPPSFSFPLEWYFFALAIFLMIGDNPRSLLKAYLPVHRVMLKEYLATIYGLNFFLVGITVTTWYLLCPGSLLFYFESLLCLLALSALFASLQLFIDPVLVLMIFATLFALVITFNDFPFLSVLMALRWTSHQLDNLCGSLLTLIISFGMTHF